MNLASTSARPGDLVARSHPTARRVIGGFFVMMSGVHLGLVAADPEVYRTFADQSALAFVRHAWRDIVMAAPAVWGLLLMLGELVIGALLLVGGRLARIGWACAIAFHLLLLPFGWWVWVWSVPATVLLVVLARADIRATHEGTP